MDKEVNNVKAVMTVASVKRRVIFMVIIVAAFGPVRELGRGILCHRTVTI